MDIKDIPLIAAAFINGTRNWLGFSNVDIERKAAYRYQICLGCDTISDDKTECDKSKNGCGCKLWMRTRGSKPCIKNKWQ